MISNCCLVHILFLFSLQSVLCLFLPPFTPHLFWLLALKLIVMLRVVCQSWWWICLWVEGADFPWVVFLLFLSLSLGLVPSLLTWSTHAIKGTVYSLFCPPTHQPSGPHLQPGPTSPVGSHASLSFWLDSSQFCIGEDHLPIHYIQMISYNSCITC